MGSGVRADRNVAKETMPAGERKGGVLMAGYWTPIGWNREAL